MKIIFLGVGNFYISAKNLIRNENFDNAKTPVIIAIANEIKNEAI